MITNKLPRNKKGKTKQDIEREYDKKLITKEQYSKRKNFLINREKEVFEQIMKVNNYEE